MKDFKLIAIRPLAGCDKKFTKILSEGIPYVFYNEYDFSKYTDQSRIIKQIENVTPDLFSLKNNFKKEVKINISAIVGRRMISPIVNYLRSIYPKPYSVITSCGKSIILGITSLNFS